jgi:hypothetical protein
LYSDIISAAFVCVSSSFFIAAVFAICSYFPNISSKDAPDALSKLLAGSNISPISIIPRIIFIYFLNDEKGTIILTKADKTIKKAKFLT